MDNKTIPAAIILGLSLACLLILFWGLSKVLARTGLEKAKQQKLLRTSVSLVSAWVILLGLLAWQGFFSNFSSFPPKVAFAVILPLPVILFSSFSRSFAVIVKAAPAHWLIAFQTFRIAVELMLWSACLKNLIPVQMTFEGWNFDILSGILAIPAAYYISKRPGSVLVLIYNIIGLLLLMNIVVIAMLSAPTPFRYFMNEPANTIVGVFPFIYLPGLLVVLAYSFHIFSLRKFFLERKSS